MARGAVARGPCRGRGAGAAHRRSASRTRGSPCASAASRRSSRRRSAAATRAPARARPGQDRVPLGGLARAAHAADRAPGIQRAAAPRGAAARAGARASSSISTPRRARSAASSASCSTSPGSRRGGRWSSSLSRSISPRCSSATSSSSRPSIAGTASTGPRAACGAARCRADPDALDRMLKNLLSNAVKYSPRGGRVLRVARPGRRIGRG